MSLKSRIYAGFAIIVFLLIISGLIPFFGLAKINQGLAEASRIERVNAAVMMLDRDVQALALCVERYVESGSPSLIDQANVIDARLQETLDIADSSTDDERIAGQIDSIRMHLIRYNDQFKSVVTEREVRVNLLREELPKQSELVQTRLNSLMVGRPDNSERNITFAQCQSLFLKAERSLLRYFGNPDSQFVDESILSLKQASRGLEGIEEAGPVIEAISDFERAGYRAVQATRSYMYFVNVVMSGESSEVAHSSKMLREFARDKRTAISSALEQTTARVNRINAIVIVVTAALAVLISISLAISIVSPITSLTKAFSRLSRGESVEEIPNTSRTDEIGQMAQAAQVFSNQNSKTVELLQRSETLSETLKQQAEELHATNEELDNFAYVASHDLKSPLRGIRQLSEWIEEDAGEIVGETSRKYLRLMQSRVNKMESLLNDLLEFSRVGRMDPEVTQVDVGSIVADTLELIENPKQIKFVASDKLPVLPTAKSPLQQVLRNLIENAFKHNDRDAEGLVKLSCKRSGNFYQFAVSDNGPGIAKANHDRVFALYQRVGAASTEGSGMGLAIVKKQVEHFGGRIWIESELGKGARFCFNWPAEMQSKRDVTGASNE